MTVDVDFDTRIPRALRRVRLRRRALPPDGRLLSGAGARRRAGHARNPDEPQFARAGRTRMTLRLPAGFALVVERLARSARGGAEPVTVDSDDALYPTIVTDRVLRPGHRPPGRTRGALPAPPAAPARQRRQAAALRARGHRGAGARHRPPRARVRRRGAAARLARARAAGDAGRGAAAPRAGAGARRRHPGLRPDLRHLPLQPAAQVPPPARSRAPSSPSLADAAVRAHEAPADRARAAGVLAAHLTELFARARFERLEYAPDLLRPFDFVPAVDQMLYAPLLASSETLLRRRRRSRRHPRRRARLGGGRTGARASSTTSSPICWARSASPPPRAPCCATARRCAPPPRARTAPTSAGSGSSG